MASGIIDLKYKIYMKVASPVKKKKPKKNQKKKPKKQKLAAEMRSAVSYASD